MKNLLVEICQDCGYKDPPNQKGITLYLLIDGWLSGNVIEYVRKHTGCAKQTVTNSIKRALPDKPVGTFSTVQWLLGKWGLKHCYRCDTVKELTDFYTNSSKYDGYMDSCKVCSKQARIDSYNKNPGKELSKNLVRKRLISEYQTPSWANLEAIAEIYNNRPEGYHVDHIIPLNGKNVCGLHVETNLQYLTVEENLSKKNKFNGAID